MHHGQNITHPVTVPYLSKVVILVSISHHQGPMSCSISIKHPQMGISATELMKTIYLFLGITQILILSRTVPSKFSLLRPCEIVHVRDPDYRAHHGIHWSSHHHHQLIVSIFFKLAFIFPSQWVRMGIGPGGKGESSQGKKKEKEKENEKAASQNSC